MRAGWESNSDGHAGVVNNGSRWGIKGSSETSEGLAAVYRFEEGINEEGINAANARQGSGTGEGRLSYVGLSGGFGTLTVGRVWGASYNHFAFVDKAHKYGSTGTTARISNAVSYAVDVGSVSFQADILADPASMRHSRTHWETYDTGPVASSAQRDDKDVDASQLGATLALGDNGKVAVYYENNSNTWGPGKFAAGSNRTVKNAGIGGEYTVGGMTMHLGYGETKYKHDPDLTADALRAAQSESPVPAHTVEGKSKRTYVGISGGLGDTGVSFVFQGYSEKLSGESLSVAETPVRTKLEFENTSPWVLGLSRDLGGGASVHLEHNNTDVDEEKSQTYLGLQVDF